VVDALAGICGRSVLDRETFRAAAPGQEDRQKGKALFHPIGWHHRRG
jgi:hypothetical protein